MVSAQTPPSFPQTQAQLTRLAEDVWVWAAGGYNSLIITSEEGALVTEPSNQSNRGVSTLLPAVVKALSPQGVRYVVFSHDHEDHNTGGDVFAATAEFVAHERAAPKIAARNDPRSPVPTVTFAQHMSLDLGGKSIDLHFFGRNHSDNSIVLHYPARRLAHGVDWVEVGRAPFRDFPDSYPEEWVTGLDELIATLEFDTIVPGHMPPAPKSGLLEVRDNLTDLMTAIRDALAMGLAENSPEMVASVRAALAPRYGRLNSFDEFLPLNVEGILRIWAERGE
jgi:glyoxylase-like metal-dependent hydrolase (beta-lactamase superfamily II)